MTTATYSVPAKPRRKAVRKVSLRFFEDSANGEWGLTHADTLDGSGDNSFNAFWDGMGLFHDVFEHAHEYQDPHFRGEAAMNVGGEMAAMGAMWYYIDSCYLHNRLNPNSIHSSDTTALHGTFDLVQESISEGYCQFGYLLESNVPTQAPTEDSGLEWIIEEYNKRVAAIEPRSEDTREAEFAKAYKASVTPERVADLHRYGFNMAAKLVPSSYPNGNTLADFITRWSAFCKAHDAEELATYYRGIDFTIYQDREGLVSWKARFVPTPYADENGQFAPLNQAVMRSSDDWS